MKAKSTAPIKPRPGTKLQDLERSGCARAKRVIDLTCIALAVPVLVPLAAFLAVLLRCLSRGPLLFSQQRIGFRGRSFTCYKFRTMKRDAETGTHQEHFRKLMRSREPMTKLDAKGDPRLIPLGGLLRATGLDELPQLYNVLRGEMSLVGPRPSLPYEYEIFSPYQRSRCETVPGLTGLWQVSGKNRTTFDEMIELDRYYAQHHTAWMDIWILLRTPFALFQQVLHTAIARCRPPARLRRPALPERREGRHLAIDQHPAAAMTAQQTVAGDLGRR